jgi:valyl-tRNA synthetase
MTSTSEISKQYEPAEVEQRWNRFWAENKFFHAKDSDPTVPFSITLPPPNVTGSLHIGHALGSTMQDILVRWKRMQGFNAMWMPGIDHASIAVHVLLEKDIKRRENKTRFDLGREEFMKRAWAWKERSGNRISEQEKLMGFSLDWPRERFTMDERSNKAVREAFVRLFDEGLIFRAKRMINWDPGSETVVSDLEVDTAEENGSLWSIKYPIVGGGEIIVATTRPETMLGDTAVAVHAKDERYLAFHGKEVELPLTGRRIPIVPIDIIREGKVWPDIAFGSGAVKVTPAHDPNDYEVSQIASLPILEVIDRTGKMKDVPAKYVGMSVEEARRAVVADLEAAELLVETKPYKVPRGRSQRSGAVIEPMLMEQWWVKAKPLADKALAAVEQGKTKFVPEHHTKTFTHWMTNIQDWCISRQLWWGHQIPAFYCDNGHTTVSREDLTTCATCGAAVTQDPDILDTWFSSGLWPFSTLGWPEQTKALATFYPNNVLVTAPDIIFFWVARMMMMGLHFMKKVPFRTVYLTSTVTDASGKKMSKTKGNVIDPLDVVNGATIQTLLDRVDIEKPPDIEGIKKQIKKQMPEGIEAMGSDALRFCLAALNTGGSYIKLSIDTVKTSRNFINKLWNATRFALMNFDGYDPERFEAQLATRREMLGVPERWLMSRLQVVTDEVDKSLEAFRFADAANALRHFIYDDLCDWYVELAKPHLHQSEDLVQDAAKAAHRHVVQGVLASVLETTMRLLHPFAPFVTEEIWQKLPKPQQLPESLMITVFPRADQAWRDDAAEAEIKVLQDVVGACRMMRTTFGVPPTQRLDIEIRATDSKQQATLEAFFGFMQKIAKVNAKLSTATGNVPGAARQVVSSTLEIVMPLGGLIDPVVEKKRLAKEIEKSNKEIGTLEKKLGNADFVAKADPEVVAENRSRLTEEKAMVERLMEALKTVEAT